MTVIAGSQGRFERRFRPVLQSSGHLQAHSSARLPQQRADRTIHSLDNASSVCNCAVFLDEPPVAHLHMSELLLDHPELVFDLGSDARLALLNRVLSSLPSPCCCPAPCVCLVALPRARLTLVSWILFSLFYALVTRVAKDVGLLPVHQLVGLRHVVGVGCCAESTVCASPTLHPRQCAPSSRSATGCPSWSGGGLVHVRHWCSWWSWALLSAWHRPPYPAAAGDACQ